MDPTVKKKICNEVYSKYPNFVGMQPKISNQTEGRYLLLFESQEQLPGGKQFSQTLRVVTNEAGNILKMSTSRG